MTRPSSATTSQNTSSQKNHDSRTTNPKGEVLGEPDRKTVATWGRLDKDEGALQLAKEMKVHVCTQGWFSTLNVDEAVDYVGISTDYATANLITEAGFGCVHHELKQS